jgi:predicted porin
MKKIIVVATGLGIACAAHAQSSVTLYGLIDEGLDWQNNARGSSLTSLGSGLLQGSRFGLRGKEDLGSGLSAVFVLENGFDVNTGKLGQGGLMFGRQAWTGLSSDQGTLTFGRQYDSVVDFVNPFAVANTWGGPISGHPGDVDQMAHTNRTNNSVKYRSPEIGGFSFGGMYSFGGVAGNITRNQIASIGADYGRGPFSAGVAFLDVRQPNVSLWGGTGAPAATVNGVPGANFAGSPVTTGYASAHSLEVVAAGAAWRQGKATVSANYTNTRFKGLGDTSAGPVPVGGISGTAIFNTGELNASYQLTPAFSLNAAWHVTRTGGVSGFTGATYNQGVLNTTYALSKATLVYLTGIYQRASGTDSTGHAAVASIYQLTPSSNNHQLAARLGILHRF